MAVEVDEGEDRPSQSNTLRALRVLDWYSGRELTQMPLEGDRQRGELVPSMTLPMLR
jgi:hypothetical protein